MKRKKKGNTRRRNIPNRMKKEKDRTVRGRIKDKKKILMLALLLRILAIMTIKQRNNILFNEHTHAIITY